MSAPRRQAVSAIADAIEARRCAHPVRVAIDGSPASGKTTLGAELALVLRARGREVIQASIEEFLRPRSERYRRGPDSWQGCYEDSFDFERLWGELLRPLGPSGDRRYRTAIYDREHDLPVDAPHAQANHDAVLLFDGVFLFRPELFDAWDFRIFVSVGAEETVRRSRIRDAEVFGSPDGAERRFRARYLPSQQHYRLTVRPTELADVVFANDEPAHPAVLVS